MHPVRRELWEPFVRSGPSNSRALWHVVNPDSASGLSFCSRSLTGPTARTDAEVEASEWSWCATCVERRRSAIEHAERVLRALAPNALTGDEQEHATRGELRRE